MDSKKSNNEQRLLTLLNELLVKEAEYIIAMNIIYPKFKIFNKKKVTLNDLEFLTNELEILSNLIKTFYEYTNQIEINHNCKYSGEFSIPNFSKIRENINEKEFKERKKILIYLLELKQEYESNTNETLSKLEYEIKNSKVEKIIVDALSNYDKVKNIVDKEIFSKLKSKFRKN